MAVIGRHLKFKIQWQKYDFLGILQIDKQKNTRFYLKFNDFSPVWTIIICLGLLRRWV